MSNLATEGSPMGQRWPWAIFALIGVCLLLFPSIGPLLDHHFAERDPNHTHVYLGLVVPDHVHPYEESHAHAHINAELGSNHNESTSHTDRNIVYLTSQDGTGRDAPAINSPVMPVDIVFVDPEDDWFLSGLARDQIIPPDAFIPTPKRPPRI